MRHSCTTATLSMGNELRAPRAGVLNDGARRSTNGSNAPAELHSGHVALSTIEVATLHSLLRGPIDDLLTFILLFV